MTPLFPARRSAERFDSLVEGGRRDDVDPSTSDLLELVGALRSVPAPEARPEFVADLRERLMVAAMSELPVAPAGERDDVARLTIKPSRTRRERRVGIALGAVAILGATTSMAVASQGAIPGDPLYPVKRALENTQAGFSVGDDAKGETILGNASGRLDEVDELARRDDPDAKLVTQTLNTFTDQATQAGDLLMTDYEQHGHEQSIQQVHEFAAEAMGSLSELKPVDPAGRPRRAGQRRSGGLRHRRGSHRTSAPTAARASPSCRHRCWPAPVRPWATSPTCWPAGSSRAPTCRALTPQAPPSLSTTAARARATRAA